MATGKAFNRELSKLFNEMWDADVHRLRPGKDYTIDVQGKAGPAQPGDSAIQDNAARHLFHNVNEERLRSIKTFASETCSFVNGGYAFISLLDNYETSTGVAEVVTPEEIVENNCFLDAILATEVMREKRNQIDYKGYVARKNKTRPDKDDQVLSIQFSWKGSVKPVGSTFIGVSPEFEFALYTVIFLMSEERVTRETVKIDEYELQVVVWRHGHHIGTAYPVLLSTTSED
ncbi:hypothetical protein DV515_00014752 [Chloebia gouldiae]|uniref:Uridylate-specific endoribonuclease n=1 Tax=Chloebia gouldiae TaxID=44316 RepID=A0A3L8RXH0_CHLGU|nr:hypothetical protein DV515_00014752 [Chloebia gouldiae]